MSPQGAFAFGCWGHGAFFWLLVRFRFLFALALSSFYAPPYGLRLQIPPVPQPSPGSVPREPAPRGLRALQRRSSGTARCLESLPQEHQLLRPGQAVEADAGRRIARTGQLLLLPGCAPPAG